MTNNISKAQKEYLQKIKKENLLISILRIGLLLTFIIMWELFADIGLLDDFIFSSPSRVVRCFFRLLLSGNLLPHIGITLLETLLSFLFVIIIGIILAILMWLSQRLSKVIEPFLVTLNSLPKSALAPILIVWLGNNTKTIIVAAVSVAVFGTILTLYTGFLETDKDKLKLIKTFGGNRMQMLTKVVIPSNIPTIISTMKVNLGLSLVGVIIGEFLAAKKGLGYLVIYGSQVFKMDWVIMSIILLCVIAVVLYKGINVLEKMIK